ncbi:unnamed protein product, partial [Effrenium voratum]
MEQAGHEPYTKQYVIQVDQSFDRQTWHRKNEQLTPCLIPKGKYVVTARWSLLGAKEKMMLQGVGPEEYMRYQMNTLSDSQLADFCGNAFSAPVCLAALMGTIAAWKPRGFSFNFK